MEEPYSLPDGKCEETIATSNYADYSSWLNCTFCHLAMGIEQETGILIIREEFHEAIHQSVLESTTIESQLKDMVTDSDEADTDEP